MVTDRDLSGKDQCVYGESGFNYAPKGGPNIDASTGGQSTVTDDKHCDVCLSTHDLCPVPPTIDDSIDFFLSSLYSGRHFFKYADIPGFCDIDGRTIDLDGSTILRPYGRELNILHSDFIRPLWRPLYPIYDVRNSGTYENLFYCRKSAPRGGSGGLSLPFSLPSRHPQGFCSADPFCMGYYTYYDP